MTRTHRLRRDETRYLCGLRVTDGTIPTTGTPTCRRCLAALELAAEADAMVADLGRAIAGAAGRSAKRVDNRTPGQISRLRKRLARAKHAIASGRR